MAALRLLLAGGRFTVTNTWPVLAVAAFGLPIQFGLDYSFLELSRRVGERQDLFFLYFTFHLLVQSLLDAFYFSLLYAVAWSRLQRSAIGYRSWRDWAALSFWNLLIFRLSFYLVYVFGLMLLMLPMLVFCLVLPYLDLVIVFEPRPLGQAVRRNLALLTALPGPAAGLALLRFGLLAWAPFLLLAARVPDFYSYLYGYLAAILSVPLDVSFLALYSFLDQGKPPPGFPGTAFDLPGWKT